MSGQVKSLDSLTGLRFLAAFAVFVHHVSGKFGIEHIRWPLGAQAVSFFFVLSGFILTYVYHDRLKLSNVKKFYFTRWARIWPLHFVCLVISICLLGWEVFWHAPDLAKQFVTCTALLQSWIPNTKWAFAINGVSWSISTEMFFYLMFPLFLLGGQKKFWIKYFCLLGLMAILVPSLTMLSQSSNLAHIDFTRLGHTNPLLRLPEFCTGMGLGYIYLNRSKLESRLLDRSVWTDTIAEIGCLSLIFGYQKLYYIYTVGFKLQNSTWGGPFLASWVGFTSGCLVFALVIYVFSRSRGFLSRLFSTRPLVFLGEVSFAFYMIHQITIRIAIGISPYYEGIAPWVVGACIAAISLGFSVILFKLVEMPCKSALLAIYDGDWKKGFTIPAQATWVFATSRLSIPVAMLIVVPIFTLTNNRATLNSETNVSSIVDSTDIELRDIKFGKNLTLKGYQVEPKASGLLIQLAWEKSGTIERSRFIHVIDDTGKVVGHGPRETQLFRSAKNGKVFVDSFLLPDKLIKSGTSIGIGMHGRETGMAWINKGERSLKERRLNLITYEELVEIAQKRERRFGVRVSSAKDSSVKKR